MPHPPEQKAETRARILQGARRLFNRRGFSEVSIEEVMSAAGLTRGGFYNHFSG
jgi:AcrR family transcriptional regulator